MQADGASVQLLKQTKKQRERQKKNQGIQKPDGAAKPTKLHDARRKRRPVIKPIRGRTGMGEA
jgi:hypothetical protein